MALYDRPYYTDSPFDAVRVWGHDSDHLAILTDGQGYAVGRVPGIYALHPDAQQVSPEELEATEGYQAEAQAHAARVLAAALRQEED